MAKWISPLSVTGFVTATMLLSIGLCSGVPCIPTGLQYGVWADRCPASDLRLRAEVSAHNLVRDRWRPVLIDAEALWIEHSIYGRLNYSYPLSRTLDARFELLNAAGEPIPGLASRNLAWKNNQGSLEIKVPDVPDGDYRLRTTIDAGFESIEVDLALPFYRPALVHVMSDRPLYKPGQEVLLRSAVLRKRDSKPIGERPGTWRILDPAGIEMMVEKVPTDAFGVSATTFPVDSEADRGNWTAQYVTGTDVDEIHFMVKPFELPRFTVEMEPDKKWYAAGDPVRITGTARYTSGAPVRAATVEVSVGLASGRWPIPLAWEEPIQVRTASDGRFEIKLGLVPSDLVDVAKVSVRARVTDEAKETVGGSSTLVLSEESLALTAVTELRSGLVEKFNNRAYLRVTTPDGRPLRNTTLQLSNPYDTASPSMQAETDEDGVAAIQVDPGAPVTIVVPAAPFRPRPLRPAAPRLLVAKEIPQHRSLDLAERRAFDRVHPAIAACGTLAVGAQSVAVGLLVRSDGSVHSATGPKHALGQCVVQANRAARFPRGDWRTYQIEWQVPDSLQPHLVLTNVGAFGLQAGATASLNRAALQARRCFRRGQGISDDLFDLHWSQRKDSGKLAIQVDPLGSAGLAPSVRSCARAAFGAVGLTTKADADASGVTRAVLSVPVGPGQHKPKATTITGFQFAVQASVAGSPVGEGKLTLGVGSIPNLRLRATPTLAGPGQTVTIEVLRGPDFRGTLPKKIHLMQRGRSVAKSVLDPKTRTAAFEIPATVHGFLEVNVLGAKTVIYARPDRELSVVLSTDNDVYRPGDTAKLRVETRAGGQGVPATVSLAGVDQTLSQLAPLLQPDDWGRITVLAQGAEAFGSFGPRALQLGQIQGENAAKATVLLVSQLPGNAVEDVGVAAAGSVRPDEVEVLTANFYRGMEALVAKVRAWERSAPKEQQITPERTSTWWTEVLNTSKPAIVDAYGLPLTLRSLPDDLQDQTSPHQIVADSTRLSEDIENWSAWIEEHAP